MMAQEISVGRVTVVIPVRDRPEMLRRAVKSVLAQSFQDFDLVVVDDASQLDLSEVRDLVEGAGHHWLSLTKNIGPAGARNAGAQMVKSEWLAFLDSDDVWEVEKLQQQVDWHAGHAGIEISQCEEQWVRNGRPFNKKANQAQPEGVIFENCVRVCCISPSCVMMSQKLWQRLGGFDERYRVCEDYELWLRTTLNEPAGLVKGDGGALVTRHGGHGDQLSFALPAMDRFRVMALLDLMLKVELSPQQKRWVLSGILQRSEVLLKGAQKRAKEEDVRIYGLAAKNDWQSMAEGMEGICF